MSFLYFVFSLEVKIGNHNFKAGVKATTMVYALKIYFTVLKEIKKKN